MTKKKAPVAAANGAGAKDEPDLTPSKLSKEAVQSLQRRYEAWKKGPYSSTVPVGPDSDIVRNLWVRLRLLCEFLDHPTVREATTRQAMEFVYARFPEEPIVTFDVGCVHWLALAVPRDDVDHDGSEQGLYDARCDRGLFLWRERQLYELPRARLDPAFGRVRNKRNFPRAEDGDPAPWIHAGWLFRDRMARTAGTPLSGYAISLASEVKRAPKTVRDGIEKAEYLLKLPHLMMS